jgi:DNA polymerase III subunit gamma/tau
VMGYRIFSRKYRPAHFRDMIGQEMICQVLTRSLQQHKLPHAWLFSGPSGVGKTTCARILARCLSCTDAADSCDIPCDHCSACRDILSGESLDFLEIDGASNNGVEEVRQLKEFIEFRPQQARFRVILIDEVHMLSTSAFNALLKTLEEPPEHVKFIFATTEVEKILPTVLARTQRYDFRPVSNEVLKIYLQKIAENEKIKLEGKAAGIIAGMASGSVRNALTLLEQFSSSGEISYEELAEFSGQALPRQVEEFFQLIWRHETKLAVELIDQLENQGINFILFSRKCLQYLRRVIEQEVGVVDVFCEFPESIRMEDLIYQARLFYDLSSQMKDPDTASSLFLLLAVKLSLRPSMIPMDEIVERLESQETAFTVTGGNSSPKEEIDPNETKEPVTQSFTEPVTGDGNDLMKQVTEILAERRKITLQSCLKNANFERHGLKVKLTVSHPFHHNLLADPENREVLEELLREILKEKISLEVNLRPPPPYREEESFSTEEVFLDKIPEEKISENIEKLKNVFDGDLE